MKLSVKATGIAMAGVAAAVNAANNAANNDGRGRCAKCGLSKGLAGWAMG
jgi:hypothetical protein